MHSFTLAMKGAVLILLVVVAVGNAKIFNRCKSADDCEEGECCVNYVITPIFGGRCANLRQEGENCTPLINQKEENPDMHHFQCPCKGGLHCVATHELKIGDHVIRHQPECVVPGDETGATEPDTTPFPEPTPA